MAGVVAALAIVVALGAVYLFAFRGEDESGGTAVESWLPPELTGESEMTLEPLAGGTMRVGAASVQVFPGTFAEAVRVTASLGTDGELTLHAEPPLDLALPARITLPLPPNTGWGEDPKRWPVVVGSGDGPALVLQPNTVEGDSLSVDVPHFSGYLPAAWESAGKLLATLGKVLSAPPAPKQPGGVDVGMSLPENYDTDASVGQVRIHVRATTGGPKPESPPAGKLPAEWQAFSGVNVLVSGFRRSASNQPLEEVLLGNSPIGDGGGAQLDVTLPPGGLWEETNAGQAVLVIKLVKDGQTVLEKTVPVPIGGYWAAFQCWRGRDTARAWKRFTVYYLKSPEQSGHPDRHYQTDSAGTYTAQTGPALYEPARVLDACSALSAAYDAFNSAAHFGDAANAPSDEMDVWLQNWDENYAGNVGNYVVLSVKAATAEEFRVNAAHELAHRFQHQYSTGLFGSGGWLHDASAEYLAHRAFLPAGESNQTMSRFFGGNPAWVNNGLFSSVEADNYSASSFLAFLADAYGMNIAREVWVEGGSGRANVTSWETHLDNLVKRHAPGSSLADAWGSFMNAYLVDAKAWGDWKGLTPWVALTDVTFDAASPSSLFQSHRAPTPYFSAGGVLFRAANTNAVTIVTHITAFPAQRASESATSWYGLGAGDAADGTMTPLTLAFVSGKADYTGSFRLGAMKDALGPGPKARIVHVYRGLHGGGYNWIRYDTWALPRVSNVEFDHSSGKLTWPKSPVEGLRDESKEELFATYELVAQRSGRPDEWVVLDTVSGFGMDSYDAVVDPARLSREGLEAPVCVRVKDRADNTSPEGCPDGSTIYTGTTSQGTTIRLAVNTAAKTWRLQQLDYVLPSTSCAVLGFPAKGDLATIATGPAGELGWDAIQSWAEAYYRKFFTTRAEMDAGFRDLWGWMTGGVVDNRQLGFGVPSATLQANLLHDWTSLDAFLKSDDSWGAASFGTITADGASVSGSFHLPYSNLWCQGMIDVTYTANRIK